MHHCHCSCNANEEQSQIVEAIGTDPIEVLYQRRCANFIYVVPKGLRELMSDISREVIRVHPSNVNMFIADYLNTLIITRENAKIAMRFVEDVGDTAELLTDLMQHTKLSRNQIDKSARIIQRTFKRLVKTRKYNDTADVQKAVTAKMIERLKISLTQANKAATVIQNAYHVYKLRQERKYRVHEDPELHMPFRHIDWQIAAQKTLDIFKNIRAVRMSEYHNAATLIQAAYRGYYTRKFVKDYWILMKKDEVKLDPADESIKVKKNWAARILQKFFRRIVAKIKRDKRTLFSMSKQSPSDIISPEQFDNLMGKILEIDKNHKLVKLEEEETVSVHATTSKDFEEIRDRSARIIQRFFRRIVARKKTEFTYEHKYDAGEEDSDMFEFDSEIEDLFGEEEEEYYY